MKKEYDNTASVLKNCSPIYEIDNFKNGGTDL